MMNTPVTIGLIQEAVTSDIAANVERAVERVREAAGRGAQIICLKELFNSPYFCKAQKADRFDLAEPIPGPTTDVCRSSPKSWMSSSSCRLRTAGRGRLSQFRGVIDAGREPAWRVSEDAHSG